MLEFVDASLLSNLSIDSALYVMLSAHCLIGGTAAIVAQLKGRDLSKWLMLGLVGGTATLISALLLKEIEA